MGRKMPIFYNALLLTGVNLALRLVSTSFQVFLSGRIGAAGIGLLQLVLSVASMTVTAGMAGIRTTAMYLTAEELGKGRGENVTQVLRACFLYSLLFSGVVGGGVYLFAPTIAEAWIGDLRVVGAVRLFAVFLPVSCFAGIMVGYYTAANRILTLAAVEVAEQLCSMALTAGMLLCWAGRDMARACESVIFGSAAGSVLTLLCLVLLTKTDSVPAGKKLHIRRRLLGTALPLAVADDLKMGINTVENLMVPKRLALYTSQALAQFGIVSGMVFPLIMLPAAILFGLADLLIPEMARCSAAESRGRIRYLSRRSLRVACIYGIFCGGILFLTAEEVCMALYGSPEAGEQLRWYALLVPLLYCDLVVDAMNKGLGQQKICVRYNILTALMDVVGLYVLLPILGMRGYFISFALSHLVNGVLSLRLLVKTVNLRPRLSVLLLYCATMGISLYFGEKVPGAWLKCLAFLVVLYLSLTLCGIIRREDMRWILGLWKIGRGEQKNPKFLEKSV